MNVLYDETISTTDVYRYKINQGGELGLKVSNGSDRHVKITFQDGELESVWFNLEKADIEDKWVILGAIADKIQALKSHHYE